MWSFLASFIGGPIINGLVKAYKAKIDAKSKDNAMAVDLAASEIQGEIALRQTEASIIRQEQGWWLTALPRPIMGLSAAFLVGKLFVWDLALGQWTGGSTDLLSDQAYWLLTVIVTAYFGSRTLEKVVKIFKR